MFKSDFMFETLMPGLFSISARMSLTPPLTISSTIAEAFLRQSIVLKISSCTNSGAFFKPASSQSRIMSYVQSLSLRLCSPFRSWNYLCLFKISKSLATISFTNPARLYWGFQPSCVLDLVGSPINKSTSVGL